MINRMRISLHTLFTAHPAEAGETYIQHLSFTVLMALRFVRLAIVLLTHGLLPFLLTRTGSTQFEAIHRIMRVRKAKLDASDTPDSENIYEGAFI